MVFKRYFFNADLCKSNADIRRYFNLRPSVLHLRESAFKKGFTLIEILISLLIFGLGIVILFNLFPLALQSFAYSRKLQEVSILAERKLEELKAIEELSAGEMNGEEKDLNWNITIKPLGDQDIELKHVELDIELYFQGKPQKQRFVTYLAN